MISQAYRLRTFEEVVGILYEPTYDEGALVARVGKISVYLPTEMEPVLHPLIGEKIGILRTDNGYRSRIIVTPRRKEQVNETSTQLNGCKEIVQ